MRYTKEQKIEAVAKVDELTSRMSIVDACNEVGISQPSYNTWKVLIEESQEAAVYEECEAIVDALLEEPELAFTEALDSVFQRYVTQVERLLDADSASARLAGQLLDKCMCDIQAAMDCADSEQQA